MKLITIKPNTEFSQSKNCWLFIQVRSVAVYLWRFWRMDNTDTCPRIELWTP